MLLFVYHNIYIYFVEGYECRAFQGAHKLLTTKFIPYIIMEFWSPYQHKLHDTDPGNCNDIQIKEMLEMLLSLGFVPHSIAKYRNTFSDIIGEEVTVETFMTAKAMLNVIWTHKNAKKLR